MKSIKLMAAATALVIVAACGQKSENVQVPYSAAHRGCHIEGLIPENSLAGIAMAAKYGYRAIECDAHYTKDSVIIIMHDRTINRTCRTADTYGEIPEKLKYEDLTYEELRNGYVLASSCEKYRTPVPTFDEALQALKEYGITPMIHSDVVEAFEKAHEVLGDNFIAFDTNYEALKKAREFSSCLILWDPGKRSAEEVIPMLDSLGGRCGVSSMGWNLLCEEYVSKIKEAGYEVQNSIFPVPHDIEGMACGSTIVLSDFSLFAVPGSEKAAGCQKSFVRKKELAAGEEASWSWDSREFGSIEAYFTVSGDVEMTVNGKYAYHLCGKGVRRIGGWRLYDSEPCITFKANEDSVIESLEFKVYTY